MKCNAQQVEEDSIDSVAKTPLYWTLIGDRRFGFIVSVAPIAASARPHKFLSGRC